MKASRVNVREKCSRQIAVIEDAASSGVLGEMSTHVCGRRALAVGRWRLVSQHRQLARDARFDRAEIGPIGVLFLGHRTVTRSTHR
jgi:hypothetical protein